MITHLHWKSLSSELSHKIFKAANVSMILFNLFPMCRGNWSPIKLQDKVAVTRKGETPAEVYLDNVPASVISILKGRKWRNMILNRNGT